MNSSRYPILASIAREVLAIPISSVASESTFSTGGRILDAYRSSLTSASVEALMCTEDWLKGVVPSFLSSEDLDNIDRIEDAKMSKDIKTSVLLLYCYMLNFHSFFCRTIFFARCRKLLILCVSC